MRDRAVRSLVEIPGDEAAAALQDALGHPDAAVRRCAALALGARGEIEAVPTLVDMVVDEVHDVDAADALAALATGPAVADRIAAMLVERLAGGSAGPSARRRLAEALAGVPGAVASRALDELARDEDRTVALTATYVRTLREAR